ncbi:MAG: hypothetical protein IJ253_08245 [Bacteroidaceae bacterium]|nr:hypothetical protein [Bacteroidaceae bacterium]
MRKRVFLLLAALTCLAETSVWALQPNAEGVYEIGSARDLMDFAALVGSGNYNADACLTADIDMSSVSNFTPIAPSTDNSTAYRGIFDGRGHTISNLTIHTDAGFTGYVGLFSCVCGTLLENLCMKNVSITTDSPTPVATGPLVGRSSSSVIQNVAVLGVKLDLKARGEQTTGYGGVIGYASSNTKSFISYCFTDYETWGNCGSKATITACYGGDDVATMAADGTLCYKLNHGQVTTVWYQTLGKDPYPVLDATHKQVYDAGKMSCDGTLLEGTLTYTNSPSASGRAPHDYDHGICRNCGFCNVEYKELVDDAYNLDDARDVLWFQTIVNNGRRTANARLTADIDMNEVSHQFRPIGNMKSLYCGTFDGQFHTMSNLQIDMEEDTFVGLIGIAGAGMTLKNLTFDASCSFRGNRHVGPVGGSLSGQQGDVSIINVGNEGNVYAITSDAGGIIGHNQGSSATFHILNCYSTGTIAGPKRNAAIAAWMGNQGRGMMAGCWSTAHVENPQDEAHYLYRFDGTDISHERLYAMHGQQGTIVTDAQMKSGEVCWMLNGNTIYAAHWYQTIGEDPYPLPKAEHGLVYKYGKSYYSVSDGGEDFSLFRKRMIESGDYLSLIEENRYGTVRTRLGWMTALVLLVLALLAVAVTAIRSSRRRGRQLGQTNQQLQAANTQLEQTCLALAEANEQLLQANHQLEQARLQLSESVAIKEEYIGRLFYTHSEFAVKMEKLTRAIQNIIRTKQTDHLEQVLRNDMFLSQRREMYAAFDETFLRLFPDFVEHFNLLFPPEARTYPDSPNALTSEMRIFALIRLGITDNERIARFLNYSLQTVKNYKTRVKNRSNIPNEEFEARVMAL